MHPEIFTLCVKDLIMLVQAIFMQISLEELQLLLLLL